MNGKLLFQWYATVGPVGYFPASGTAATAFTLVILTLIAPLDMLSYWILIVLFYSVAHYSIQKILSIYHDEDPSEIVIDEVIGSLVTFCALPLTPGVLILGFIFFRFFDITKFGPVGWMEKLPGASGILLDDVMAGLLSNMLLRLIVKYAP